MSLRLADYFVVVGFDQRKERSGSSSGVVEQRYPIVDWTDVPFIQGIEVFCQPQGWSLVNQPQKPIFFVAVLTDINGDRHNAAIFAFTEPVALALQQERHSLTYAPRCLVLIARHAHISILKQCLGLIYTAHVDRLQAPLETLIGNMLGAVAIPPPGSPPLRFSLGAGDLQVIEPRKFAAVPVTGTSVYSLFSQLSPHNVVQILCAAMSEFKIVFFSQSYIRLHNSCHAIISLMYPFKYTHVYIPLLPSALIEVLNTPTPFIMGCHASLRAEIHDIYDVTMVDLDSGSLDVPQCVRIPKLPDFLQQRLHNDLCMVLQPDLLTADEAFPPSEGSGDNSSSSTGRSNSILSQDPNVLDKQIRAIFLRIFAQMMQGYRCCLTVVRIHPKPLIVFNRSAFLNRDAKNSSEFVQKILDCMFFHTFVVERGPPYRPCDLFDEVYVEMQHLIKSRVQHINDIAKLLYENEHHGSQFLQRVPQPTQGAFTRIHQPPFPTLVDTQIQNIIEQNTSSKPNSSNGKNSHELQCRIVPNAGINSRSASCSSRKLDVLRNCVKCIFDKNLSEARKCLPGVMRAFESGANRAALAYELGRYVNASRVELEVAQFDLVVRLMNCALQEDGTVDTIGIAILLLPLTQVFCRRLTSNVVQFIYTCLQEHSVWVRMDFWEAAFYQDVEKNIIALYQESKEFPSSALELCASQMKLALDNTDKFQIGTHTQREEQTVYSQAVEYIYLITCLRIPPDLKTHRHSERASSNPGAAGSENNSVCDTDSIDGESTFGGEENSTPIIKQNVVKFISRFVDKVCNEAGVTEEHMRQLSSMIPQRVDMQIDEMRAVHRESERLPPVCKAKILQPCLLSGETLLAEGIRAYLISDGRSDDLVMPLIPAEGALFVTNYRIVFKGTPMDPYLCEHNVVRAFPIASLSKDKKFALPKDLALDQCLSDGLQLRSNTFELMKLALDTEVSVESLELLRQQWQNAPLFALSKGQVLMVAKSKEKHATLRIKAKKKLIQSAVRAGITKGRNYAATLTAHTMPVDRTLLATVPDDGPFSMAPWEATLTKDYQRLHLNAHNGVRLHAHTQNLCKTYPPLVAVPFSVNDDRLQKVAKCYRHSRLPVITWRHSRTKALLLRAASLHGKGLAHRIGAQGSQGENSMWIEQDKYIGIIVAGATQNSNSATGSPGSGASSQTMSGFQRSNIHRWSGGKSGAMTYRTSHRESLSDRHSITSMLSASDSDAASNYSRSALYIVSEKSQVRGLKAPYNTEFIPFDYHEVSKVRAAFKLLTRACCAASPIESGQPGLLSQIENSEWLKQISNILNLSNIIVDLMDLEGSSVMLCLEEGWDVTCQVSALAQLCSDPHYRKIDGFWTLVEKEWMAFGHRFAYRGNISPLSSGFAPIFLQFLDIVHQLLIQFPTSFEFNHFYLKFIAYHCVSARFRTFLYDGGVSQSADMDTEAPELFEYIQKVHVNAPIFYNYWYVAEYEEVLRPSANISMLEIWEYYFEDHLAHGSPYEFEIVLAENQTSLEDSDYVPDRSSVHYQRRLKINGYNHNVSDEAAFPMMLEEYRKAEIDLGRNTQKWRNVWTKLEAQSLPLHQPKPVTSPSAMDLGVNIVRKVDVLVRGLSGKESFNSHAHRFERHYYNTATYCDHCSNLLLGLVKPGMRCIDCGYNCHDKCHDLAPKNCTKVKPPKETVVSVSAQDRLPDSAYDQLTSRLMETKTHEGFLHKRGVLFKGWKQRWFVLDSTKHQLRYYDTDEDDSQIKGVIELSEVTSIYQHGETFEVRTKNRTYGLMARSEKQAQEWVEKIQSCLQ